MTTEWPAVRIEEVAEKVGMGPFGSSIKVETFVPTGVPVISGQHLHGFKLDESPGFSFITPDHADRLRNANVRRGDIIFTHAGNIGQVAYVHDGSRFDRYVISQRQFYMRPHRSRIIPEYVVAYFKTPEGRHKLLANTSQVGVPSIARPVTYLRTIDIPLPPLSEQQAIADVIGVLDDKIELNERMNETLEATARAIFKSWFVDYDPVRAQVGGRGPGLPSELADLFPDRFNSSELGDIPAGWRVVDIYEAAHVVYGAPFKSSLFNEDGIGLPLIRIRDLSTHNPELSTPEKHPKGYVVKPGDLVVGMDGEFRAHLWRGPKAWLNQRVCCFRPRGGTPRAFVHYSIDGPLHDFETSKTGTTVIHLGKADIDTFRIVMPPRAVLNAFGKLTDAIDLRVILAAEEMRNLTMVRDALLPKLVSGELRVEDAETLVDVSV